MKKLLKIAAVIAALGMAFASCQQGDDDDDDSGKKAQSSSYTVTASSIGDTLASLAKAGTTEATLTVPAAKDGELSTIAAALKANGSVKVALDLSGATALTSIAGGTFTDCTSLAAITVPANVTSVGAQAFAGCTALKTATLGSGAGSGTSVGAAAFKDCTALETVAVGESVTSIGAEAFSGCTKLSSVTFANGTGWYWYADGATAGEAITVTNAQTNAALLRSGGGSLRRETSAASSGSGDESGYYTITIASNVEHGTVLGYAGKVAAGEHVTFAYGNNWPDELTVGGTRYIILRYIPDAGYDFYSFTVSGNTTLEETGEHHFTMPASDITVSVTFLSISSNNTPATTSNVAETIAALTQSGTVTVTGEATDSLLSDISTALSRDNIHVDLDLSGVVGLTEIGKKAFYGCRALASVELPSSLASIGGEAFFGCTALTSVELPSSLTSIGGGAFYGCRALASVTFPDGLESIGTEAFSGCTALAPVELPSSLTSIGNFAFYNCAALTNFTVASGNTTYKAVDGVLYNADGTTLICYPAGNAATSFTVPNTVTVISDGAFSGCTALESVVLPSSLKSIGFRVFSGCTALTSVTFPDGLESIGIEAFSGCTALAPVELPSSLTSIGIRAFLGCTALTEFTVASGNTTYKAVDGVLYSADGTMLICYPAGNVATSFTVPNTVTVISDAAFSGCTALASVMFSDGLESIESFAFSDCTALTSVTIPASVTSIDYFAFYRCTALTSVTFIKTTGWNVEVNAPAANAIRLRNGDVLKRTTNEE